MALLTRHKPSTQMQQEIVVVSDKVESVFASAFRENLSNANLIRTNDLNHYIPNEKTTNDPIIDGYIRMLRSKYLEFSKTTAPSGAEAKLPLLHDDPKFYFVTARYNLPRKMRKAHEDQLGKVPSNFDVDRHLELELDFLRTIPYIHKQSTLLHNHICNKTVKNHFRPKNTQFLPLGLSFIDFSGSKKGYFKLHKLPHTHAIYLIHPTKIEAFENLVSNKFQLEGLQTNELHGRYANTFNIQEVHVEEVANTRNDLYRSISYASKYHSSKFNQRLEYDTRSLSFDVFNKLR